MYTVLIIGAYSESIINFRGDLIRFLVKKNCKVYAMSEKTTVENELKIKNLGATFISYNVKRHGLNPINEFKTFLDLKKNINAIKPDILIAYTIKPVIWSGLAIFFNKKIKYFPLIEGLGYTFQKKDLRRLILRKLVIYLYKISLYKSTGAIFLNNDNQNRFIDNNIISKDKCYIIDGIGVNLDYFAKQELQSGDLTFLMISRFLGEKGVKEYLQAAKIIKQKFSNIKFQLLGTFDNSLDSISPKLIEDAIREKIIDIIPQQKDVREYLKNCHVFVLPSYHEGMPRTIMEAMSIGRPILTTDVPGCNDTVKNLENGLLVNKADHIDLANKMIWFIENTDKIKIMGDKSRLIATERFDVNIINTNLYYIIINQF
jgi:glycosyltransferase involved in cell wall biosynthesis